MSRFFLDASFLQSAYELPEEIARKLLKCLLLFSNDPRHPGLNREPLSCKAADLECLRVDLEYRIIMLKGDRVPLLLFVGINEDACRFADRTEALMSAAVREPAPEDPAADESPITPAPVKIEAVGELLVIGRKYLPLAHFLLTRPPGELLVRLSFAEVEGIIRSGLPPSAREHLAWWSNERNHRVQATAWLSVGWKVRKVNQKAEWVTFDRIFPTCLEDWT